MATLVDALPSDQTCRGAPDTVLRCTVEGGQKVWQGVHSGNDAVPKTSCPADSMPWRNQVVCDNTGGTQCFETMHEKYGTAGAVCVIPTSDAALVASHTGIESLRHTRPISYDRRIDEKELKAFAPCYMQPFGGMKEAALIAYVPIGKRDVCEALQADARHACRASCDKSKRCEQMVHDLYDDANEKPYECALHTAKLPIAHEHDKREWWRWIRHNQYDCRASGWKCDDAELREYSGGASCTTDSTCDARFEAGVCDLNKGVCRVGTTKGSRCTTHEDCDHISGVKGKCAANQRCETGRTGIGAAYYVPRECKPDASADSLHSYCGRITSKDGQERYTGVCQAFDFHGRTYHGCRAFETQGDIANTIADEEDWQSQKRLANFHAKHPSWERLSLCPEDAVSIIDGRRVCLHTTHTVYMQDDSVKATDDRRAAERCDARMCSDEDCTVGLCVRDGAGACHPSGPHHVALLGAP